jgi:phosphoribosylcarboxyaminoimidazole (NCAIR) mutase
MKIKSKFITRTSLVALQIALGMTAANASRYASFAAFLESQEGISSESARHLTHQPKKITHHALKEKIEVFKQAEGEGDAIKEQLIQRSQVEAHRSTREIFEEVRGGGARAVLVRLVLDENENHIASTRHLLALGVDAGAITGDQIDAMLAFRAGGRVDPTLADVDGWADNDDVHRPRRILVAAVGLDSTDPDLRRGARLCGAVGIANPSAEQIRAAVAFRAGGHNNPTQVEINGWANNNDANRPYRVILAGHGLDSTNARLLNATGKCVAVGIGAPTPDQIDGADAFIQGGHNNPTQGQIDGWANNNDGDRPRRVLLALLGLDSNDADLLAAVTHWEGLGVGNPTANQINGTDAFIQGGHNNPTQAEIDGWVNNVGTRAARVLVGAAGLDATDANLIVAAARCSTVGIGNPTANQINGANAFIQGNHATPTQAEINGWVNNVGTRAARVLVGAAGLNATDANLIAAAAHCVTLGIGNPIANQINGADAFIQGGHNNPSQLEIDGWINNVGTRAARVKVGAARLDATNDNYINAAHILITTLRKNNPDDEDIKNIKHLMVNLGYGNNITDNLYNAITAFTAWPTRAHVEKWIGERAKRGDIVKAVKAFYDEGVRDASAAEIDRWIDSPTRGRTNIKSKKQFVAWVKAGNRL